MQPPIDERLAALAATQHNLFTAEQARSVGVDSATICRRAARGRLTVVTHGVYAMGSAPLSSDALLQAALLAAGDDAVLSHDSLVHAVGAWDRHDGHVHVLSTRHVASRIPSFATFHRTSWLPDHHRGIVDGRPATTVPRALCDLGTTRTAHQITAIMRQAWCSGP